MAEEALSAEGELAAITRPRPSVVNSGDVVDLSSEVGSGVVDEDEGESAADSSG